MNKRKVLLINPSSEHQTRLPGPTQINFEQHSHAPPLGLMYISSYLSKNTDAEVKIFNFQTPERPSYTDLKKTLTEFNPALVGISVMTAFWYDGLQAAKFVKSVNPETKVLVGGHHMWQFASETIAHPEIDYVCIGEGEETTAELIEVIEGTRPASTVDGLVWKNKTKVQTNLPRSVLSDLDKFPFPDRTITKPGDYRMAADDHFPAAIMIRTRGCPRRCGFCQNHDKKYRQRSPENTIAEMLELKSQGYRSIDFYDDNFNQSKSHLRDFCNLLIKRKINMPWISRCRVDRIDEDLVKLMKKAGCYRILFGVESGSQRILDHIDKEITLDQCREAFKICKKSGIQTLGYFIIGFPGETVKEAENTVKFSRELDPDFLMFFMLFPAAGTPLYFEALQSPDFGGDYFREFARNPWPDSQAKIWETAMSYKQMCQLVKKAHLGFYFNPKILFRFMRRIQGFNDFWFKLKMACTLLILSRKGNIKAQKLSQSLSS